MTDISIGQFFPGNSVLHRMDPRIKIVLLGALFVIIFSSYNLLSSAITALFILFIVLLSGISFKFYLKGLKTVIFIVIFTSVFNLFYGTGEVLFQFYFLKITWSGIFNTLRICFRIISLIFCSTALTFTTSPNSFTEAIERLIKPLEIFHVKVHEIAMMMTIALRFIPTLLEETDKIIKAQKARGAELETGNLSKRVKALIPILIPLFVSAFRRAYELATAMECRCYNGGKGRTKMKILRIQKLDVYAMIISAALFVGVILCNL